ncbi:MAG: methyltransferase family protein [Conexivisphaera sp.]
MKDIWKFAYWPLAWVASLLTPALACPQRLHGAAYWTSLALGIAIAAWGVAHVSVAGRTLRLLGHSQPGEGPWPDRLVTSGIYSCMRHPQHMGLAAAPVGLALMSGYPAAMIGSGWAVAAALAFVLLVEEPECRSRFGRDYQEYASSVPPFSLDPGCLARGLGFIRGLGREPHPRTGTSMGPGRRRRTTGASWSSPWTVTRP